MIYILFSILRQICLSKIRDIIHEICRNSHFRALKIQNFLRPPTKPPPLLKWRRRAWCFPVNFAKFLRTRFLHNISRRLLLHVKDTKTGLERGHKSIGASVSS